MTESGKQHRKIRSYVLREGRLTAGQQRAFATLWPQFGIDFTPGQSLDLPGIFGNPNPVILEIGFGNGASLAEMASQHPEQNYLGIEVHSPGVGRLLLEIKERGLSNLRVMRHDAVELLESGITPATLSAVYLFFPDPWHKKKHHKRRILQPALIRLLAQAIKPGGTFHAATDWEHYAEQMLEVLSAANELFENSAGPGNFSPRPDYRPITKFEQRGARLGHGVWDLIFLRQ
ncbi:MAG: tRNA (guanosine(46)-N7)-methyltransferase TrmB [Gammaproteobacteria bacterium]|nr:tRNA (guanosine(46)-N7)-methyltransferase TrmB [Gammaproteobacteria bacterium]